MEDSLSSPRIASSSISYCSSLSVRYICTIHHGDISKRYITACASVNSWSGRNPKIFQRITRSRSPKGTGSLMAHAPSSARILSRARVAMLRRSTLRTGALVDLSRNLTACEEWMARVLVVGWDGADWRILDPMLEKGALPNL